MMNLFTRLVCGTVAVVSLCGLLGCSAAKSIINNNLPDISNALQLDNQTVTGSVNGSRATISGNGSRSFTFANTSLSQGNALVEVRHTQQLDKSVTVTVPSGTLPATFQVRNITLNIVVKDTQTNSNGGTDTRTFTANLNIAGPILFGRSGTSNTYTTTSSPTFSELLISGDNLNQFRNIVTGGSTPNNVDVRLSFDTDDTALPSGSTITFKTVNGTAKIKI